MAKATENKERLKKIVWKIGNLYSIEPRSYSRGIELCQNFHDYGLATTLGKFSKNGIDAPEAIVDECRKCSNAMANVAGNHLFYLSIKPPALEFSLEHVKHISAAALQNGHGVHFDSHDHSLAEATLYLLKKSMVQFGSESKNNEKWFWGLTLPSRWKRSFADMRWAVKNGVRVRLVKGEFKAASSSDEMNPKEGFLKLVENMAGSVPELALATHDHALAKEAIYCAGKKGTNVQIELLFGWPAKQMVALSKELNVPLRFYVAYGDALLLYGIRQFLLNPEKFFRPNLREVFRGHRSKISIILNALCLDGKNLWTQQKFQSDIQAGR